MHSEIDSIDRVKILRGLRLQQFDVLIGINLLREGLDLPEVSLVAILDADKEGFLRSARSLIQTIGRAARNINGKAILYGDKITKSMQQAIDETERRRGKQKDWNRKNGISPQTIQKEINEIIDGIDRGTSKKGGKRGKRLNKMLGDEIGIDLLRSPKDLSKKLADLEKKMYKHADDMEFEKAATLRDEIAILKKRVFV